MPVLEMPDYIAHAKTIAARVRTNLWTEIESFSDAVYPEVNVKDAIASMPSSPIKPESSLYIPVSRLLNTISLAYYLTCHASPGIKPIVFHSNSEQVTLGDFLGVQMKPDSASGVGDLPLLYRAARLFLEKQALSRKDFPCSANTSVGEDKLKLDRMMAQFKAYMGNHKRYRVDMATVHGYRLAQAPAAKGSKAKPRKPARKGPAAGSQPEPVAENATNGSGNGAGGHAYDVVLASLSAGGLTCSPPVDVTSIDPWIAHVVMVYDSYATRNASFALAPDSFVRWDVELDDGRTLALAPFYVAPPPGRVTFATFEVPSAASVGPDLETQFRNDETLGFVKFSWQDEAREWKERDLLERVHKGGWLPGVVRPYPSQLKYPTPSLQQLGLDGHGTSRVFEIVHLGSIGEPLSQCETPKEIFMVIYDLLETHLNMLEPGRDIIHRDLSWFNVFCKPKHDPTLLPDKVVLNKPCIASILGEGDDPVALVADLDHSAIFSELLARDGAKRKEKTGTPMFRAIELSNPSALADHFNSDTTNLDRLFYALREIEKDKYAEYLDKAFPGDTRTFAATVKKIIDREKERRHELTQGDESQLYTILDSPHKPRHDAESAYWILLWALGRALPLGEPDELTEEFNAFCGAMLKEGSSEPGSSCRQNYLKSQMVERILHPLLKCFQELLVSMTTYFSIPWQLYEVEFSLGEEHAHMAMRRLLLLVFAQNRDQLHIKLDTAQPRRCTVFKKETYVRSLPASILAKTGDASSGMTPDQTEDIPPTTVALKRPFEDDDETEEEDEDEEDEEDEDDGDAGDDNAASSAHPHAQPPAKRRNTADPNKAGESAKNTKATWEERYTEDEHLDKRNACSLRLKIWKDRMLWFGSGYQ